MENKLQHTSVTPKDLTIHLLEQITNGFSDEHKVGSGGYGNVYKGVLHTGEEIAVKKLHPMPGLDDVQFKKEFNNLMRVQHQNIVRFVGYCYEIRHKHVQYNGEHVFAKIEDRALCFEYLQGGSLDKHLDDESCGLDWHVRYNIIKGICDGLNYLHNESENPIVHMDLKPENILLDKNMMPKIADFGLSRLFSPQTYTTKKIIGTPGYMPPEYIDRRRVSPKFDIFSLGVIIKEIMAGRMGNSRSTEISSEQFIGLVHENWKKRLQATMPRHTSLELEVKTCIEIALRCVEADGAKRPTITEIVDELNKIDTAKMSLICQMTEFASEFNDDQATSLSEQNEQGGFCFNSLQEEMDVPTSASLGAMGPLLWKLDSLMATEDTFPGEVNNEIKLLTEGVKKINTSLVDLSDVEDPPLTAKCWMKEVRELFYDMEDYFDQIMHSGAGADAKTGTVGKSGLLKISRLQKTKVKRRPQMATKISEFRARVQDASERRERYGLESITFKPRFVSYGHRLPILRAEPADRLVDHGPMDKLESLSSGKEKQLKVVSIVGHGGVGKTTLAKRLYQKLGRQFECRAFVRVSLNPDIRRLLTSTFLQIQRQQPCVHWDVQELTDSIAKHLQNKRYFIVIDDIWAASMWDIISRAFPEGNCCSRIITTTQIEDAAFACCSYRSERIFKLRAFNDDQSRKLFFSRIFVSEYNCPQEFKEVSYGIIRKCGGLPLAIINVASLLACEPKLVMERWMHIQHSLCSSSRTDPTSEGMKEVLNLIYNNLPHHLKTCLLYLNMYPDNYTIHKDDLVKQWIAEGFLSTEEQDTEEVAGGYFDELIGRGMIQPVDTNYNDEVLSCTVHHMVLDFIAYKSMEENFITILDNIQTIQGLPDKVRRLSIQFGSAKCAKIPAGFRMSQVRSLIFFGLFTCIPSNVDYRLLQVLILHIWPDHDKMTFDLSRICELFRLRYLKIACNMTVKLPTRMRGLLYLETLEVDARVAAVPSDIVHLQSLLNLCLPSEKDLPHGIGHMTSLRRLGYFNLSNNSRYNVKNLGELTNLQDLHLTCSTEPSDLLQVGNMELLGSILGKCINLKSLILDAGASSTSISCDISCEGLSSVSPPLALLQRLELLPRICVFSNIPKWIGELGKLCILKIAVRKLSRKDIGILEGLPALTALSLYVHTVPVERIVFDKPGFSVLKYLKFRCSVPWLKFEADAMPNLGNLRLDFNALGADQDGTAPISIEHLSGLKEITAKIGGAGAGADAESALTAAIRNHPSNPTINVQLVDWIFYGDGDRSMVKQERELEDIRISTLSESSSRLPVPELEKVESKPAIVMEDAMVSASKGAMDTLLTKLTALTAKLIGTRRKEVMILKDELGAMNALLEKLADMAELNFQMKDWRNQMREMTYDIEDCIDDLMLQFDEDNAEPGFIHQATAYPEKWDVLQKFILQIQSLMGKGDLGSMVHKTEVQILGSSYMATESRLPAVYDKAVGLVGMDGPRDELVRLMMKHKVVCILGPGGVGKTTLAKEVYNKIKWRFGRRVFVPVPQKIDITRLLGNIRHLQDTRYLIVLDGVWSVETWKYIQRVLPENYRNHASRIIITTNIRDVAESCVGHSSDFIYHMRHLHPNDSYRLFRSIIFGSERSCPVALGNVGDKILEACGGIPLAIIIIASFLANKPTEVAQWEMVEKRMDPVEKGDLTTEGMKKIFHICYSDLPRHMKSCLLYLSVFPRNHVIRKDRVIWRWIAEGFIPRRGEESLWETGESYFQELIRRKLIEPAYGDEEDDDVPTSCIVHGVILEFITLLSNEENFVTTDAKTTYMRHGVIRRLTVSYSNQEEDDAFRPITEDLSKVRSLTISGVVQWGFPSTLIRMCFLRVLDLEDNENLGNRHLEGIGRLVLLRYLGLGRTGIEVLPEEIGELQQLETLDLRRTTRVRTLPASIVGLRKLVRLLLDELVELPREIWKVEELEELSTIVVDSSNSLDSVAELLIKSKRLRMLGVRWGWHADYHNARDRETTETNFRSFLKEVGKSNLQSLLLEGYRGDDFLDVLLDSWVPPHHLRRFELTISVPYIGRVPPKMASLVNLTHLRTGIYEVEAKGLSVLGDLPNLILLKLESLKFDAERRLIISRDGFRCLVVFSYTCAGMGLQFTRGAMPQLRRLRIEFSASETEYLYRDLDFGIQHLSCLTRVHAAITEQVHGRKAAEAAEAAITEQVSKNPNSPVLELSRGRR